MKFRFNTKIFFVIFLITILLFNSSGYFLLYLSSTHFVKKLVMKKLLNHELDHETILLSISKKDIQNKKISFEWIHAKEFRFNGKMYDIKKNLTDKDSLRFLCYYDEKENLLEELFCKFSNSEKENHNKRNSLNIFPFLSLFFTHIEIINFYSTSTYFINSPLNNSPQPLIDIKTPPPQAGLA